MELPLKDYGRYKADLADYEAYACDDEDVDGVVHSRFGIDDRARATQVLHGRFVAPALQHDGGRVPLEIELGSLADDLSLERSAELVRSTFVHFYTGHFYCDRVGELVVHVPDGSSCVIPHDDCSGSVAF